MPFRIVFFMGLCRMRISQGIELSQKGRESTHVIKVENNMAGAVLYDSFKTRRLCHSVTQPPLLDARKLEA